MDLMHIGFVILNSIVISLPEEAFIFYFALFILGKFEYIKLKAYNIPKFVACVIPSAFVANLLRELFPQIENLLIIIGIFIMFLLIVLVYGLRDAKDIFRAFISTCLSVITSALFQLVYLPILSYGTGITINDLNKSSLLMFIWTLPERAMEISLATLITVRKSMASRINFFTILSKNRNVAFITLFLLLFNVGFLATMIKLICFDNILASTSLLNVVVIIALVVIFPVMNISLILVVTYSMYYRYSIRLLFSKERINTLISVLAVYSEEKNYGKIDNLVTDLHNQVNIL